MTTRKYTLKRRARRQEATRRRIVEATMALHEELGPRDTTISAIAERAGVQRLTVYRHFPDEAQLFQACTSGWLEQNPPPDPSLWEDLKDPGDRFRLALESLYGYYRKTERMWRGAYRDRDDIPALQEPMAAVDAYLDRVRSGLLVDRGGRDGEEEDAALRSILGHALRFSTWQSLNQEGLDDAGMAALVGLWVEAAQTVTAP